MEAMRTAENSNGRALDIELLGKAGMKLNQTESSSGQIAKAPTLITPPSQLDTHATGVHLRAHLLNKETEWSRANGADGSEVYPPVSEAEESTLEPTTASSGGSQSALYSALGSLLQRQLTDEEGRALQLFKYQALDMSSRSPGQTNGVTAVRVIARFLQAWSTAIRNHRADAVPLLRCFDVTCTSPHDDLYFCLHRVIISCAQHIVSFNRYSGGLYRFWMRLDDSFAIYDAMSVIRALRQDSITNAIEDGETPEMLDTTKLELEQRSGAESESLYEQTVVADEASSLARDEPGPVVVKLHRVPLDPLIEGALWREQARSSARWRLVQYAESTQIPTCVALSTLEGGLAVDSSTRANGLAERLPGTCYQGQNRVLAKRHRDLWRKERKLQLLMYASRPKEPAWMLSWREKHAIANFMDWLYNEYQRDRDEEEGDDDNGPDAVALYTPEPNHRSRKTRASRTLLQNGKGNIGKQARMAIPRATRTGCRQDDDSLEASAARGGSAYAGLVGLYNLGSTCYMSAVLQVLIHLPPVRNFFLADLHQAFCLRRVEALAQGQDPELACFNCALDAFIVQAYRASLESPQRAAHWRPVSDAVLVGKEKPLPGSRGAYSAAATPVHDHDHDDHESLMSPTIAALPQPAHDETLNLDASEADEKQRVHGDKATEKSGSIAVTRSATPSANSMSDVTTEPDNAPRRLLKRSRAARTRSKEIAHLKTWTTSTTDQDNRVDFANAAQECANENGTDEAPVSGTLRERNALLPVSAAVLAPQKLLDVTWKHVETLASYCQHDAHEYLLSALNLMHTHWTFTLDDDERRQQLQRRLLETVMEEQHSSLSAAAQLPLRCHCLAHRTFAGLIQSEIVCTQCAASSVRFEEFLDISLDLVRRNGSAKTATEPFAETIPNTLTDCLRRFTHRERLDPSGAPTICNCNETSQEGTEPSPLQTKQLSLRQLPPIICFHLKRFEHSSQAPPTKLDVDFVFPLCGLDLTPFMTRAARGETEGFSCTSASTVSDNEPAILDEALAPRQLYDLIAFISHIGRIDQGHYVAHVRRGRHHEWFKFDDETVSIDRGIPSAEAHQTNSPWMTSKEVYVLLYAIRPECLWVRST